jgi:hypothetical protein
MIFEKNAKKRVLTRRFFAKTTRHLLDPGTASNKLFKCKNQVDMTKLLFEKLKFAQFNIFSKHFFLDLFCF